MARPKKIIFDENDKKILLASFIPEANRMIEIRVRMTAAMTRMTNATTKHASLLKDIDNIERIVFLHRGGNYEIPVEREIIEAAMKSLSKDIENAIQEIQSIAKEITDDR